MSWKLSNFMSSRLAQAIAAADTTIYIDADEVDSLPTLGVGDKAKAVIFNADDREIVNITAWNTNGTLTVERGQETTTGIAWAAGTKIVHTPTAEILQAVLDATVQAVYRGTASGTNTITVTGTGSVPTPNDGDEITFEVLNTNTSSVDVSYTNGSTSIGPYDLLKQDRTEFAAGELAAGYHVKARYDASAGDFILINQGSKHYDITHINTGPLDAGNILPNGGFDAWNNATSFATPASGTETADNVIAEYDGTIGAFTVSRQTFTLGQTDVAGGPKYYLRWDQSSAGSASSYRRLRMRIPRIGKYNLETIIASIYAKADIARNVTAKLIQSFGTGGSPSAEVTLATEVWALGTGWAQFDLSAAVTSITGKTLGSGGNDGLLLELSLPINTSMTMDFAMGQVELGSVASKTHSRLPWTTEQGGSGGSFVSLAALAAALSLSAGTWLTQASFNSGNPDLAAIEALAGTTGIPAKTAANTWALRQLTVGTGLSVTNPAGVAGDPTVSLGTALTNYNADPMSVAELASITAPFGTAAFVADNTLCHLAGAETLTGLKRFEQALATDIVRWGNTTNTSVLSPRWTDATTFEFVPSPAGVADATKGHGYDVTNTRWFFDTNVLFSGVGLGSGGSASAPMYSFSGDPNTGIWNRAADQVGIACGGVDLAFYATSGLGLVQGQFFAPDGSVGNPAYSFTNDTNTGMYRVGSDELALVANGAQRVNIDTSRVLITGGNDLVLVGSALAPTSVYSVGYRGSPVTTQNAAYGFVLTDAGCTIYHDEVTARTYTIPANASVAFPVGTIIIIDNTGNSGAAGAITLSITSDTLRRGDGTSGTGSRTIPASAKAQIQKISSTVWVITGVFT